MKTINMEQQQAFLHLLVREIAETCNDFKRAGAFRFIQMSARRRLICRLTHVRGSFPQIAPPIAMNEALIAMNAVEFLQGAMRSPAATLIVDASSGSHLVTEQMAASGRPLNAPWMIDGVERECDEK